MLLSSLGPIGQCPAHSSDAHERMAASWPHRATHNRQFVWHSIAKECVQPTDSAQPACEWPVRPRSAHELGH
eukprot:5291879-Alexandrium_andersonii.AAC.1